MLARAEMSGSGRCALPRTCFSQPIATHSTLRPRHMSKRAARLRLQRASGQVMTTYSRPAPPLVRMTKLLAWCSTKYCSPGVRRCTRRGGAPGWPGSTRWTCGRCFRLLWVIGIRQVCRSSATASGSRVASAAPGWPGSTRWTCGRCRGLVRQTQGLGLRAQRPAGRGPPGEPAAGEEGLCNGLRV